MSTDTEEQTTSIPENEKEKDFETEVLKLLKEILWLLTQLMPPKRR